MRTRSSWIWYWIVGAVLASGAGAQQYTTIIDNLPTCTGNRNGRIIAVSDATSDSDCTTGGATGEDRFVHPCICDTLNALGPYWKAVGGGAGGGNGDVVGPASAVDNGVPRFDGTTGKLIQGGSVLIIDDAGNLAVKNGGGYFDSSLNSGMYFPTGAITSFYAGAFDNIFALRKVGAGDFRVALDDGSRIAWVASGDPESGTVDTTMERDAAGIVKLTSVLNLAPLASTPRTCDATAEGDIYSDTSHALCWCDASTWQKLSGAGTCA